MVSIIINMLNYSYKILLIVINCLLLQLLNAQDLQKVDSLEMSLKFAEKTNDKVDILLNLSNELKNNDPDKALNYAQEAYGLSEEADYEKGILNSMIRLAQIYWMITDFKTAMDFAMKSKEMAEELSAVKELALSLHIIGRVYSDLGDYDKSSEYYFECLKLYEQINDKLGIAKSLSYIGRLYFQQQNTEKALEYFFRSLNIAKEINDRKGIANGLYNVGIAYGTLEDYEKLNQYLKEAVDINKEFGDKKWEGINYINMGVINQKQKNYDIAFENFQQALLIFENLKHTFFLDKCYINLGDYFLETNDIEQSLEYATKAFESAEKHGLLKNVHNSAELLNKIYLVKKDTLNAFKYNIIKYQMKDSLNIEKSNTKLSRLELQYEFYKKEQGKKIEQQRKDFIIIIIVISLIFGLIVIVLIYYRQRIKARYVRLEKQKLEGELEFKNKELTSNVMSLIKKNEILTEISKKLRKVEKEAVKKETKEAVKKIAFELQENTNEKIWQEFELRFNQVHTDFYNKLNKQFPDLWPSEQKLCAFLRLNMTTKEIAELTGQSVPTLEQARYRLRKKLSITNSEVNLITFLSQI